MSTPRPARADAVQRTRPRRRRVRWNLLPYVLIAPAVAMVLFISLYPIVNAILISLQNFNFVRPREIAFVGLGNYVKLITDDTVFRAALPQTFRWALVITVVQMLVGLPVALFLNVDFRFRGVARTIVLVPWVVPPAVTSIIWTFMFDANFGVINDILVKLGIITGFVAWLSGDTTSFLVMVIAMLWTGFPFMAVMLLAALQTIPDHLYEAAVVDGANVWQRFAFVTIPQILPTVLLLLLLRTMWLANHVDVIFLMTLGGPGVSNYTLAVYSYIVTSVQFDVGFASAIAMVLAIILLATSTIYVRYIERTREFVR